VKSKTGFQLPQDVSFEKQHLSNAWAYVFRHRLLGEIGRILLQELDVRLDSGQRAPKRHAAGPTVASGWGIFLCAEDLILRG
jgi:hypothetical protein